MTMAMSFSSSSADSFKPLQHQGDQQVQEGADFEFLRFSSTQQRAGWIHRECLTQVFKRAITPQRVNAAARCSVSQAVKDKSYNLTFPRLSVGSPLHLQGLSKDFSGCAPGYGAEVRSR